MASLRHNIANLVSVPITMIKLGLIKICYMKNFFFKGIERFSPNVVINLDSKSTIKLGNRISIHSRGRISSVAGGCLEIGEKSSFNIGCIITCRNKIIIGKNVTVGPNTMMYDHDHVFNSNDGVLKKEYILDEICIGDNTWIGAGTIVLAGTSIGKNCVIAAGSVIKGNIPDNTLIVQKKESSFINV